MTALPYPAAPSLPPTPLQLGFAQPAEWHPHAATWTVWPRDADDWFGAGLDLARSEFALFLNRLAEFEPVRVLVHDEAILANAQKFLSEAAQQSGAIAFHLIPNHDLWLRDSGPIFVKNAAQQVAAVNWIFNAWGNRFPAEIDNQIPQHLADLLSLQLFHPGIVMEGGALEVNGQGLCLTTRQCLQATSRNPQCSQADLEAYLRDYLGIHEVLWLEQGLEGDHTDGHIDTITRFVGDRTVVTSLCEAPEDANFAPLQANLELLQQYRDRQGQGLTVIPLPLPQKRMEYQGERLPLTYANFYIANGVVLVPTYDDPNDEQALEILRGYWRNPQGLDITPREVIGIPSQGLITGGGSFHCATQQQPSGLLWPGQALA